MKHIIRVKLTVVLLAVIIFFSGLFWLAQEPRSIAYLKHEIETQLNQVHKKYAAKLDDVTLQWDGWKQGLNVHVNRLEVFAESDATVLLIPDATIKLDMLDLILHQEVQIHEMVVPRATIMINNASSEQEDIPLTNIKEPNKRTIRESVQSFIASVRERGYHFPLEKLSLSHIDVLTPQESVGTLLALQELDIGFVSSDNSLAMNLEAIVKTSDTNTLNMNIVARLEDGKESSINVKLLNLDMSYWGNVIPKLKWLNRFKPTFNLELNNIFSKNEEFVETNYTLWTSNEIYSGILPESMNADHEMYLSGNVKLEQDDHTQKWYPLMTIEGAIYNFSVDQIPTVWPKFFSKKARKWVTEHVLEGQLEKGTIKAIITPEAIKRKRMSEGQMESVLKVSGGKVQYLNDFQPFEKVKAEIYFDHNNMDLTLHEALVGKTKVSNAKVIARGFVGQGGAKYEIYGDFDGLAHDLASFARGGKSENSALNQRYKIGGTTNGAFRVKFPAVKEWSIDLLQLELDAKIAKLTIPNAIKELSVSGGDIAISTKDRDIILKGQIAIDKQLLDITYSKTLSEAAGKNAKFTLEGALSDETISKTGVETKNLFDGDIKFSVNGRNTADATIMHWHVDATEAMLKSPYLEWKKPVGEESKVEFEWRAVESKGEHTISQLNIAAEGIDIQGNGKFNKSGSYQEWSFDKVLTPKMDTKVHYVRDKKKGVKLSIRAKRLDIGPSVSHLMSDDQKNEYANLLDNNKDKQIDRSYSGALRLPLDIDIQANKLELLNDVKMENFIARMSCPDAFCDSAFMSANYVKDPTKRVDASYGPLENTKNYKLHFTSNHIGELYTGLNLSPKFQGGEVDLTAVGTREGTKKGGIILKNYKLSEAPLLAKLLNVASLSGVQELLGGKGVQFEKMNAEFEYGDLVLKIRNFKSHGSSMGLTMDGYVDLNNGTTEMTGAIIPSYVLNNLLGKVPLIGNIIIGGEGEGLIASRYTIKGGIGNPEMSVNPLSMLTPGILRNIWGGSEPTPKTETKQ